MIAIAAIHGMSLVNRQHHTRLELRCCQLPWLKALVTNCHLVEVQQLGPALVQHVVEQEHRQIGHDQQEQCIAGLVCGPQLCLLCAACNVNIA